MQGVFCGRSTSCRCLQSWKGKIQVQQVQQKTLDTSVANTINEFIFTFSGSGEGSRAAGGKCDMSISAGAPKSLARIAVPS